MCSSKLEKVLDGEAQWPPPLWLMRQAGRYLPEYRAVRSKAGDFLSLCHDPALAAEVTLQPIERFGFDAAIIFSDILVVPDALGRKVHFAEGEGPRLEPITEAAEIDGLPLEPDWTKLQPTVEALKLVRAALPAEKALLGFCGAPWTVATYMIAGRGTPDQAPARLFAYRQPEVFEKLLQKIVAVSADYLIAQLRAGASAVQIFDSWAGVLPPAEFERWCIGPVRDLIMKVRSVIPDARIIGFPRGATGHGLVEAGRSWNVQGLSVDTAGDISEMRRLLGPKPALQGNLDPLVLMAGGPALDAAIDRLLSAVKGTLFIANLGHGILQHTPVAHVERLVARIRAN